jgi:hypothetical protein
LVQRTRNDQAQVRYSVAGRSRGWVKPYAVSTVHVETGSACFLVELQNQGRWFVSGLASKPLGQFVSGLISKPLERFLPVWPENHSDGFSRIGLKTGGFRFPGLGLKTNNYSLMIWASESPQQFPGLGLKTMRALVCRLRHKTDRRMKTT